MYGLKCENWLIIMQFRLITLLVDMLLNAQFMNIKDKQVYS